LKFLGRTGPFALSLLDVETGGSPAAPAANLLAGRVTYDLDAHLRVGALATRGDPRGERTNQLGGLDAVWQTSTFQGDKNLTFAAWAARSDGDLPDGRPTGWGARVDYPNDLWDVSLQFAEFGDALDPGFYVAAIAGLVGLVSGFMPSGWTRRRSVAADSTVDDGRYDR